MLRSVVLLSCSSLVLSSCPFLMTPTLAGMENSHKRRLSSRVSVQSTLGYNVDAVKQNISGILVNTSADFGNHGPFLIRLAWHCAGTYQTSDGRGGCDGARIRFDPELSWEDNAGLQEAMDLLKPIKQQYGDALSWGDLIVLAGNTAIESMGGPTINFCGGRMDDSDGNESLPLEQRFPGSDHLIYVNAETASAQEVREAFSRMDFADKETVALVAGGHAFGQCHLSRSGFAGPWTAIPTKWSNLYLNNMFNLSYAKVTLGSGKTQWNSTGNEGVIMLGAERNMYLQDDNYKEIMKEYKNDEPKLKADFGKAWEKLMNRDMGLKPCAGEPYVPAPPPPDGLNYDDVKFAIKQFLKDANRTKDFGHWGPLLVRFAWHCAGTYRSTDHIGGCNGARILHPPEALWPDNTGLVYPTLDIDASELAVGFLYGFQEFYGADKLSWADLIIAGGTAALEDMGVRKMEICPGRKDMSAADSAAGSKYLDPAIYLNPEFATASDLKESMTIMGFTPREMTVLNGGGHSIGKAHAEKSGFEGPWTRNPTQVSNDFFKVLVSNEWEEVTTSKNRTQFTDTATGELMMLHTDLIFLEDPEFETYVMEYKDDNALFLEDFAKAWEKLINADRWGCLEEIASQPEPEESIMWIVILVASASLFAISLIAAFVMSRSVPETDQVQMTDTLRVPAS